MNPLLWPAMTNHAVDDGVDMGIDDNNSSYSEKSKGVCDLSRAFGCKNKRLLGKG